MRRPMRPRVATGKYVPIEMGLWLVDDEPVKFAADRHAHGETAGRVCGLD